MSEHQSSGDNVARKANLMRKSTRKPPRRSAPQQSRSQKLQNSVFQNTKKKSLNRRSSSENDVIEINLKYGQNEHSVAPEQVDDLIQRELRILFGNDLSSRLFRLLEDLKVWNKESIKLCESHKILLGASSIGFRPGDLGKLHTWIQEIIAQPGKSCIPPKSSFWKIRQGGGSFDSVLATESGISLCSPMHRSQSIVQHVNKRFRSEFSGIIFGILEDNMVESEDDLAYVDQSVMDAAVACGQLTLIQVNRLSDWIVSVKCRRQGMKDPNPDRIRQMNISKGFTEAMSTVTHESTLSTEEVVKSHTAISMFEKKRHFKGLRNASGDEYIGTRF